MRAVSVASCEPEFTYILWSPGSDSPAACLGIHLLAMDAHSLALCGSGSKTVTARVFQSKLYIEDLCVGS